jgi:hypothetical protein
MTDEPSRLKLAEECPVSLRSTGSLSAQCEHGVSFGCWPGASRKMWVGSRCRGGFNCYGVRTGLCPHGKATTSDSGLFNCSCAVDAKVREAESTRWQTIEARGPLLLRMAIGDVPLTGVQTALGASLWTSCEGGGIGRFCGSCALTQWRTVLTPVALATAMYNAQEPSHISACRTRRYLIADDFGEQSGLGFALTGYHALLVQATAENRTLLPSSLVLPGQTWRWCATGPKDFSCCTYALRARRSTPAHWL